MSGFSYSQCFWTLKSDWSSNSNSNPDSPAICINTLFNVSVAKACTWWMFYIIQWLKPAVIQIKYILFDTEKFSVSRRLRDLQWQLFETDSRFSTKNASLRFVVSWSHNKLLIIVLTLSERKKDKPMVEPTAITETCFLFQMFHNIRCNIT